MKKRLLFINGHLNAGGVEKSLTDILAHLNYDKYDVELLLFEDMGDYVSEVPEKVNIRLMDLHNTYGSLPKVLLRCAKIGDWFCFRMKLLLFLSRILGVQTLRFARKLIFGCKVYDVAIGFRPGICTNIAAFAVPARTRISWWHHGEYNLDAAAERDYRQACRKMDHVVSVSDSCAGFLQENIPELTKKLVVISNFISPDAIVAKANQFDPYKGDSRFHIVTVGRLAPEKHMENCIYAAKALLENGHNDFRWHIIGDGAERDKLDALIREYGVSDWVCLEGRQVNPYPYMTNADLFVHPSYVESQGIVILEAMALGVPCVVTRSLGPCEFMEDGINGMLADQNPESLAQRVLSMKNHQELYEQIKDNTECPKQFLPEQVIVKIEDMLEN